MTMTHTTDQERSEFEEWARDRYPSIDLTRDGNDYSKALAKDYWSLWQAGRRAPAVPVPQSIEQMAVDRYKVVPSHSSMFYPCAVVAGDGQQQLYIGHEAECQNMARKFTGAFLDGAFVALAAAPQPPEADHIPDAGNMVEAPVQLPEPVAYLHECGKKPSLRTLEFSKVAIQLYAKGYKSLPLYTDQQVRTILAQHGIKTK